MNRKQIKLFLTVSIMLVLTLFFIITICNAQLWKAIPPYNVLWPLWSPILSPPDPLTGIPTPIVSSLTSSTFLPKQPALVWDPSIPYFYLLYNYIPTSGSTELLYFDPTEGAFNPLYSFKVWPPSYLLTQQSITTFTGTTTTIAPNPLILPLNYASLVSFDPALWLNFWIPLINNAYQNLYGVFPALLTSAQILPTSYVYTGTYAPAI